MSACVRVYVRACVCVCERAYVRVRACVCCSPIPIFYLPVYN